MLQAAPDPAPLVPPVEDARATAYAAADGVTDALTAGRCADWYGVAASALDLAVAALQVARAEARA